MTEDEAKSIAKTAAKEAIVETFLALGIDTHEATEVQRDMAFVRNWRLSTEAVKRQGILTAVGVLVVGILGLIWLAIRGGP